MAASIDLGSLNLENRIEYAEFDAKYEAHANQAMLPDLKQVVDFLIHGDPIRPAATDVVSSLISEEKATRAAKRHYSFEALVGTWRLGFITGTQNSRKAAGGLLGAGRFIPPWIKIQISYDYDVEKSDPSFTEGQPQPSDQTARRGCVDNIVKFGPLQLVVSGPMHYLPQRNILAFDFTRMQVCLAGLTFYDGYVGDGQKRETVFFEQSLKQQAFFTYFWVSQTCIAARGRGGGLALWVRESQAS